MNNTQHRALSGLFITGTDTGVGKTEVGCALAATLSARSVRVQARKPVESGCLPAASGLLPQDGVRYFQAIKQHAPLNTITPYRFQAALSPARAAELENQTLRLSMLYKACLQDVDADDFLLVEGAGGLYSPLCHDGDNADLATALDLPLLIVAANRLGCINHIRLTLAGAYQRGLQPLAIIVNQVQESPNSEDYSAELGPLVNLPIFHFPFLPKIPNFDTAQSTLVQLCDHLQSNIMTSP